MAAIDVTPKFDFYHQTWEPGGATLKDSDTGPNKHSWKAFLKNTSNSSSTYYGAEEQSAWVELNFNKPTKVSEVVLIPCNYSYQCRYAKICGSDDGETYYELEEKMFDPSETVCIDFKTVHEYNIYRVYLESLSTSTSSGVSIDEIVFMYDADKEPTPNININPSSRIFTLPSNTYDKIMAKRGDPREGLLGFANDDKNYGDLSLVGKNGRAVRPTASIKKRVIFEGEACAVGSYNLLSDISNYKIIIVVAGYCSSTADQTKTYSIISNTIPTEIIDYGLANQFMYNASCDITRRLFYHFENFNTFKIDMIQKDDAISKIKITSIVGIY